MSLNDCGKFSNYTRDQKIEERLQIGENNITRLDSSTMSEWLEISGFWSTTNIPIVIGDSWADEGGYVSWNEHSVFLNGSQYTITAGNSVAQDGNEHIIYWVVGASEYTVATSPPSIDDSFFIVARVKDDGTLIKVWTAFQNAIIGSGYIHELTADKITSGTLDCSLLTISNLGSGDVGGLGDLATQDLADLGDLAALDVVEAAKLGTTVIDGGYIKTNLLTASNITTGTLNCSLVTLSNLVAGDVGGLGDLATLDDVGTGQLDATVISGGKIVTGLLTASNIQTGTLNCSLITVSNLSADSITSGSLSANRISGGTMEGSSLIINSGDDITIEYGGDLVLESSSTSNYSEIIFDSTLDAYGAKILLSAVYHGSELNIIPENVTSIYNPTLLIGSTTKRWNGVYIYGADGVSGDSTLAITDYFNYTGDSYFSVTVEGDIILEADDDCFMNIADKLVLGESTTLTNEVEINAVLVDINAGSSGIDIDSSGVININANIIQIPESVPLTFYDGATARCAVSQSNTYTYLMPQQNNTNTLSFGAYSSSVWANVVCAGDFIPAWPNLYDCGDSSNYWDNVWAYDLHWYDSGWQVADEFDDIALLESMIPILDEKTGKEYHDTSVLPDRFFAKLKKDKINPETQEIILKAGEYDRSFISMKTMFALLCGGFRQLMANEIRPAKEEIETLKQRATALETARARTE